MSDPRIQTDAPWDPAFSDGAFHIELTGESVWGVYDAYSNRMFLYFASDTEAIDACIALAAASDPTELDAEYARQIQKARASLAAVA